MSDEHKVPSMFDPDPRQTQPRGIPTVGVNPYAEQPGQAPPRRSRSERDRMAEELATQRAALEAARRPRSNRSGGRSGRGQARLPVGPLVAAVAVVLIGFGLVVFGALRATTLAPPATITATLHNSSRVPVLSGAVGLLGLDGPRTRVTVRAATASQTVFLGIGRASDVDAYLGTVNRLELFGHNDQDQLLTRLSGSQAALPDPAAVDVWVVSVRAKGAASVAWPDTPGQWRMVAASDGTSPAPATVEVTWSGRPPETTAPVLIAVGVVLMVGAGVALVMVSSRSGLSSAPDPARSGELGTTRRMRS